MRSRALLHRHKLDAFKEHVERAGWKLEAPIGAYEVVRAWKVINGKKQWAFVYDRQRGDHFTTHGYALALANQFVVRDELREGME